MGGSSHRCAHTGGQASNLHHAAVFNAMVLLWCSVQCCTMLWIIMLLSTILQAYQICAIASTVASSIRALSWNGSLVRNVMLPPPPEVSVITADTLFNVLEGEDEDVEAARESLALQHSELTVLHDEVCCYIACFEHSLYRGSARCHALLSPIGQELQVSWGQ